MEPHFTLGTTLGTASIFRLEGYTHELATDMTMALASSATAHVCVHTGAGTTCT